MRELNTSNTMSSIASNELNDPLTQTHSQPLQTFSSALMKRCVIIQKDERGYGLRVSGDNPVFVESVKPDGAAWRAGVRSGDRIIKVNGTLVTKLGHGEVVRMIQNCGSYVGLTLLGLKTPAAPTAPPLPLITAPQPASERTQQEYEASRVATIQQMIKQENEHLEKMMMRKNQHEIDATIKRIRALEATLEKMTFDVQRHRHASMSAENLTTNTYSDDLMTNASARKSHSFGQYDTRAPIMTMESDEENDDVANNNNNAGHSVRHSDVSDIPTHVDAIHAHSLRMTRWLLSQQCSPNALLFYTMAGHVFPALVAVTNPRRTVTRWALQIACTWLLPDSPLRFKEFKPELLQSFGATLESPNAPIDTIFVPFLASARDILQQQLESWRAAAKIGLAPVTMATPKDELYATIELLINEPLTNIDSLFDNMISHTHPNDVSSIAVMSCLVTIAQHVFACHSHPNHHLLSHADSSSPPPNPVLRLSLDHSSGASSGKKHKRHSSLPAQSRTLSPGHAEGGHRFVIPQEITKFLYCSGCMAPIWGSFGHVCAHCNMCVHVWCMKYAAEENPCPGPPENQQTPEVITGPTRSGKNRRWKSTSATRPLLEILKKTTGIAQSHLSESHAPPLLSSTSSDDDDDDSVTAEVTLPQQLTGMISNTAGSPGDVPIQSHSSTQTPSPNSGIQRSESFKQRRSSRPERSVRKRSDPALSAKEHNANALLSSNGSASAPFGTINDSTQTSDRFASPSSVNSEPPVSWASSSDEEDDHNEPSSGSVTIATPPSAHITTLPIGLSNDEPPPLPPRPPSEKRKQIHHELTETEERHVEILRMLRDVFYRPMHAEQLLSSEQLSLVFSNSLSLLKVHKTILKKLQTAQRPLEQALVDIFCGKTGVRLETAASTFCSNQKLGLDTLRARKKDSRLRYFLDSEQRSKEMPDCPLARLALEDHLGAVFQRPTKYPLLLDRLLHATPNDLPEYNMIARALARAREIVSSINESVRDSESRRRLSEIVRKTERQHSLSLDFEGHSLMREGQLTWRITKQKSIEVLMILTDKLLAILQRDSDRFILKHHSSPQTKNLLPILHLNDLLTRDVATDSTAFFIVSNDQNFFFEFSAANPEQRKAWTEAIANVSGINEKSQQHITKLRDLTTQPADDEFKKDEDQQKPEVSDEDKEKLEKSQINNKPPEDAAPVASIPIPSAPIPIPVQPEPSPPPQESPPPRPTSRVEGVIRYVREDECVPPDLISPSRVKVSCEPVTCEALAVISPEQQIAIIDDKVLQLLNEKRRILGQMQGISTSWEWSVVCDIATHDDSNDDNSHHEMTFFDKAMSVVTLLARDGLTHDAREPLMNLKDQIETLLVNITAALGDDDVDAVSNAEAICAEDLSQSFCSAEDMSEDAALYF